MTPFLERIKGDLVPTVVNYAMEDGKLRLTVVGNVGAQIKLEESKDLVSWGIFGEEVLESNQQEVVVEAEEEFKFFRVR